MGRRRWNGCNCHLLLQMYLFTSNVILSLTQFYSEYQQSTHVAENERNFNIPSTYFGKAGPSVEFT